MKPGAITEEQVQQFHEQGYLVLEGVFNKDEVKRMAEEADFIANLIVNSIICNKRLSYRMDWNETPDGVQHIRKIQPINDLSLYLTQISEDPRLLEPMRQIMGCEPVLMEEKLNYKQPLKKRLEIEGIKIRKGDDRFPIHNDWAYFQGYPQDIISSAIAIDECTPENGPLRVWPGTHKSHLEHQWCDIGLEVKPGLVDPNGGIDVLVPPGSVMFFHSLLVHNSRPNETMEPRRLMIYSHYPSRVDMGFDVKNGPARLRESPWEMEYLRKKMRGEFQDVFDINAQ